MNTNIRVRSFHRVLGLILVLPFVAWAVTGFIFFVKPGYAGAYEMIAPKTYALTDTIAIVPDSSWLQVRCFRTVLGNHLLAKTPEGWKHFNLATLKTWERPSDNDVKTLIADAIAGKERYGTEIHVSGDSIRTETGIVISLDWDSMSLSQQGSDTELIDMLYRIHYLQWTGIGFIDKIVGVVGLVFVLILAGLGIRLSYKR